MGAAGSRIALAVAAATLSACGGPLTVSLPAGPGNPIEDPAGVLAAATARCADVRSVVAEARVSGAVGRARIRATLIMGVDRAGNARVEALAGPGGPVLVLTAKAEEATLVLPRDNQVLEGASIAQILEALVGVPMAAADLAMSLAGCFGIGAAPGAGRTYGGGVAAFDLPGGMTVWTRDTAAGPRTIGGQRGIVTVMYGRDGSEGLSGVRLLVRPGTSSAGSAADLTLMLASLEVNAPIDPVAFIARVSPDAQPITLESLRRSGPLGAAARP